MHPDGVPAVERSHHGGVSDPTLLDFSANTNPDRPGGVASVYDAALAASRRYPDDGYAAFRDAAGAYLDCDPRRVVPAAGGMAALRLVLGVSVAPDDSVLVPAPSFAEYEREVRLQGADPVFAPADEVVDADPADHAAVVVCNPNNPTGAAYDADSLRALADRCRDRDALLVVDEAFLDFTDRPTLAGRPGVVVVRSLTKVFGLPGLRAGYAVATGDPLDRLERARPPWGLSTPAADVGAYCLRQTAFVERTRRRVASERRRLREALGDRFDVRPSDAPFLLLRVRGESVDDVMADARESAIAVRDARTFRGLDEHVRVAVKRGYENDRLVDALT